MLLWQTKTTSGGTYSTMKSPSSYKIDWEDLDNNSYRSKNSGNLIDTVISKSWSKIAFNYNCLSEAEIQSLLPLLATNPLYVKAKNPIFGNEYVEMEMRCSRKSAEMLETGDYTLSFNLVQKKKVAGQ
jgi:hypothetical protein